MEQILTASNSEVLRLLGSRACTRLELGRCVAGTGHEALAAARRLRPRLVILDVDMPELDGFEVCRAIKSDPDLKHCRVMLVASGILTRDKLDKFAEVGCDDVVVLPAVGTEFFSHVADLLGVPRRRHRRVNVELMARLDSGTRVWEGQVDNLSLTGAKVLLNEPLGEAETVRVRLTQEQDGRGLVIEARVVRRLEGGRAIGLQFTTLTPEARRALEALVLWDVVEEDGVPRVYLEGDFVESTDFERLGHQLAQRVEFDAAGVRYINSQGSRLWTAFLRELDEGVAYTFSRCSVAFATQASMVVGFLGRGRVVSFMAPYRCEACDRDEVRLLQTAALTAEGHGPVVPRFRCHECSGPLVLDELPERYFAFLQD
ncbi:MAG TPA: PilZ domain-containing protein [Polyangia bacterium]|jgi:CheY-like chemotaxis protein